MYQSAFGSPRFTSESIHGHANSQMQEEILPFTVRLVQNEADLEKAVRVRHSAYARHLPGLAETLREPEPLDRATGVVILLAESKLDGTPIGSARLQSNHFQSLAVEQSIELPNWLNGQSIIEVTRLSVTDGRAGRLVKTLLMKAMYQYWVDNEIDYAIATGRAPIDRQYEQLLFTDLFPDQGFIPLRHVANVPHRVMALCIETLQKRWAEACHPLYQLFFHTSHPDINILDLREMDEAKPTLRTSAERFDRLQA
ncbi:MAG: hypothetical protein Q7K26_02200 [bacterium]|nr:hypothetical protein [bacterium]